MSTLTQRAKAVLQDLEVIDNGSNDENSIWNRQTTAASSDTNLTLWNQESGTPKNAQADLDDGYWGQYDESAHGVDPIRGSLGKLTAKKMGYRRYGPAQSDLSALHSRNGGPGCGYVDDCASTSASSVGAFEPLHVPAAVDATITKEDCNASNIVMEVDDDEYWGAESWDPDARIYTGAELGQENHLKAFDPGAVSPRAASLLRTAAASAKQVESPPRSGPPSARDCLTPPSPRRSMALQDAAGAASRTSRQTPLIVTVEQTGEAAAPAQRTDRSDSSSSCDSYWGTYVG